MTTALGAWLLAAGGAALATFLAEFGDKSQLLAAGLSARLGRRVVLLGVTLGILAVQLVAVLVGAAAGAVLPARPVGIVSGVLFVLVGLWLWRETLGDGHGDDDGDEDGGDVVPGTGRLARRLATATGRSAVLAVALTFALGEMGDKTQLATVAIAAQQDAVATFVGASLGMVAANAVAVEVGARLARVLPQRTVLRGSAVLFVVVGVVVAVLAAVG
ncbi:TMEM165/GDT1 family protein [Aquipuribacter nitratireducens]|uniref:GDT1 family protein n=1 Tax=Aquipuribacter nitratireducens TaxID=650104 RepID=A0ABW0GRF6_9MICO